MKLGTYYNALELHRKEKVVFGRMLKPHRLLSTCRANGGVREDIEYLFNHQSCEPHGHVGTDLCEVAVKDPHRYHRRITSKAGIPEAQSAGMGTAANMNNLAIVTKIFKGLEVIAATTAGVGSNASRAGDSASYWQSENGSEMIDREVVRHGTINTMVFISQELTAGALVVAATVATESKTALLQELNVPSRYSEGIATGTGTDQLGIASLTGTSVVHTDANKHSKLGELIALAVRESLAEALNLQCGLTPDTRRSCLVAMERFGASEALMFSGVEKHLAPEAFQFFRSNFLSINHDPITVAAVQAWAHLRDQLAWRALPAECGRDILLRASSQVASAVAGKSIASIAFLETLSESGALFGSETALDALYQAFAIGFRMKWLGRFED